MTSRELVLRSIERRRPARIPRQLWVLPWAADRYPTQLRRIATRFPDDIVGCPYFSAAVTTVGDPYAVGTYVDEWGCTFVNRQAGVIGEVKQPLVARWEDVVRVVEPVAALQVDRQRVRDFCRRTDKFVMAPCCPRPFERLQFLRGTENVMIDLAMDEPALRALLDTIHRFYRKEVELWSTTEVDGISFMDDWGTQQALLISPACWRQIFKPLYKEYVDIAHAAGKKVFMHSDGHIHAVIPDLIEIGIDALNSQVFCMGLEALGADFKGRITFWGELDRQQLLPHGQRDDIIAAVQRYNECFYDHGGIIAQLEFGPGARPDNVETALATWAAFPADS
jgi:uroporphyrinogen decarboxylase